MSVAEINNVEKEILLITQEECAEVTQAISKVFRFGFDSVHNGKTNKEHLEEEIGDLLCMFQLLEETYLIDPANVAMHATKKRQKLEIWSSIYQKV